MTFKLFPDFVEIAQIEDLPVGASLCLAEKHVAVFNVAGKIYAIGDICPHAGGSLGLGKLDGNVVTCPWHGMKFDVTTGCFAGSPDFGVNSYPVKVVDGKVMVGL